MSGKYLPLIVDSPHVLQRMPRSLQSSDLALVASVQDLDELTIADISIVIDCLHNSIEVPRIKSALICSGSQPKANSISPSKQGSRFCGSHLARLFKARNRAKTVTEEHRIRIWMVQDHHVNGPASFRSMKLHCGDPAIRLQRKRISILFVSCTHCDRAPIASVARLYHPARTACGRGNFEGPLHG